jgi:hypothetical protein
MPRSSKPQKRVAAVNDTTPAPLTVGDVLTHLSPKVHAGISLPTWPPDAFAFAAALLKVSGAYTEIVNRWPPSGHDTIDRWFDRMRHIAKHWRESYIRSDPWPEEVGKWWGTVQSFRETPVEAIRDDRDLVEALASIVAVADQACAGMGVRTRSFSDAFLARGLVALETNASLCMAIAPSRAIVLPKMHNPLNGMTLRSLTHNLAFWEKAEVRPQWRQIDLSGVDKGLNVLLLPWPITVNPRSLRATADTCGEQMPEGFGLFTYDMPAQNAPVDDVIRMLATAEEVVGTVDAVVFPELSMTTEEFERLRAALGNRVLIAGVGETAHAKLGQNEVMIAARVLSEPVTHRQSKHHRWRIEESQIRQYGLGPALSRHKWWWEAIQLKQRFCTFFTANDWLTFCVLICEDLARQDPVAELVRTVGPNLVIALLMDGPQMTKRWSARYATVLADDPRCSVLTLTSAGFVDLSLAQTPGADRSVGLWKDGHSGEATEIVLEKGAQGVLLSLSSRMEKEWTADGRHDDETTGYLRLTGVHQIRTAKPSSNPGIAGGTTPNV